MKWWHIGALAVIGTILVKHFAFAEKARPWRSAIDKAAQRHNVNKNLLAAILYKESSFNPDAIGSKGEIGLGQFLPIAAEDIGRDISELIGNPEIQIDSSAALIALNLKRTGGDTWTTVRAYNVGIGKAKQDSTAGLAYAVDIMETALVDWLYGIFARY